MKRASEGNFAYACEKYLAYSIIAMTFAPAENCDLREIEFYREPVNGIQLKKHSPLRDKLAAIWLWMGETGIFEKYNRYWAAERPACINQLTYISVGFHYLGSLFLFLFLAYALSLSPF